MKTTTYGDVVVIENDQYQYCVTDNKGRIIVPFGKYGWISGFDNGFARVKSVRGVAGCDSEDGAIQYPKWGFIDKEGNEVLPLIYDSIWNFLGKNRKSVKVIRDGNEYWFHFETKELLDNDPDRVRHPRGRYSQGYYGGSYGHHYGEYEGSYAQDVMGYSDDVINDAFEGDPDAYWNND